MPTLFFSSHNVCAGVIYKEDFVLGAPSTLCGRLKNLSLRLNMPLLRRINNHIVMDIGQEATLLQLIDKARHYIGEQSDLVVCCRPSYKFVHNRYGFYGVKVIFKPVDGIQLKLLS